MMDLLVMRLCKCYITCSLISIWKGNLSNLYQNLAQFAPIRGYTAVYRNDIDLAIKNASKAGMLVKDLRTDCALTSRRVKNKTPHVNHMLLVPNEFVET